MLAWPGRVVNAYALIATGFTADSYREILGLDVTTAEDGAGWLTFLRPLTGRGLSGVALATSDAQAGWVAAIGAILLGITWQRCPSWPWAHTVLPLVVDQPHADSVAAQYDWIIDALADKFPEVADHLESACADLRHSPRSPTRSGTKSGPTTPQERLDKEIRRRTDVGGSSASSEPCWPSNTVKHRPTSLPGTRCTQQIPARPKFTDRTGDHRGGTDP